MGFVLVATEFKTDSGTEMQDISLGVALGSASQIALFVVRIDIIQEVSYIYISCYCFLDLF